MRYSQFYSPLIKEEGIPTPYSLQSMTFSITQVITAIYEQPQ
ncbi:hypothetical protein [Moorena bouillonii]|nr:hypothetical protein [Moorena bouillonii]